MNKGQRRLVSKCVALGLLLALVVIFDQWILAQWSWLMWVALPAMVLVASLEGRPEKPPNFEAWANSHPFIKPWLAVCAVAIAALAYITTRTQFRIPEEWRFRALVLVFLAMLGPFAVIGVFERYRELGGGNDAT